MRDLERIDAEIAELRKELETVRGSETEVYTRIVGYYRSLKNWNKGKREEYDHRRTFDATPEVIHRLAEPGTEHPTRSEEPRTAARGHSTAAHGSSETQGSAAAQDSATVQDSAAPPSGGRFEEPAAARSTVSYRYYFREGCSGCPPVRRKLQELELGGTSYDVDSDEGFAMAREDEIMATPTVIFFTEEGRPFARVTSAREIDGALDGRAVQPLR